MLVLPRPLRLLMLAQAALGGAREARLALLATAGLAIAYAWPTESMYELSQHARAKNAAYLAVTLPLAWSLARTLFPRRAASRRPVDARLSAPATSAAPGSR